MTFRFPVLHSFIRYKYVFYIEYIFWDHKYRVSTVAEAMWKHKVSSWKEGTSVKPRPGHVVLYLKQVLTWLWQFRLPPGEVGNGSGTPLPDCVIASPTDPILYQTNPRPCYPVCPKVRGLLLKPLAFVCQFLCYCGTLVRWGYYVQGPLFQCLSRPVIVQIYSFPLVEWLRLGKSTRLCGIKCDTKKTNTFCIEPRNSPGSRTQN